jgi:DNA-binding Lrp family transcriptional regulator
VPARNGVGVELLADPTRRAIVAILALSPRRPSSLARDLGLSRPAVSRQLRILEEAGFVTWAEMDRDRRGVPSFLHPVGQRRVLAWLAGTEIVRPTDGDDGRRREPADPDAIVVFGRGVRGCVRRPRSGRG